MDFPLPPDVCCNCHNREIIQITRQHFFDFDLFVVDINKELITTEFDTNVDFKGLTRYKSIISLLSSPLPPSERKYLLRLKLRATRHEFIAQWHQSRVSPGPLASTLSGTEFLTCRPFVRSAGWTLDSLQGREINTEL